MPYTSRDASLTSLQIPGGRTVLIDNRIGSADAVSTLVAFAKRGEAEGYTVISDRVQGKEPSAKGVPQLHICTLLRPGRHTDLAGVINAMGTLAASHAIERNSETRTAIRWLGNIHLERRRFALFMPKQIATVYSQSLLLPSGFLDYMILHAVIDMPASRFPLRMVDAVARIFTSRPVTNADHVTQAFLTDFFSMYDALSSSGGRPAFWTEYCNRSLLLGRSILFRDGKKRRRGKAVRISDMGELILLTRDGVEHTITSQAALL